MYQLIDKGGYTCSGCRSAIMLCTMFEILESDWFPSQKCKEEVEEFLGSCLLVELIPHPSSLLLGASEPAFIKVLF